MLLLYSYKLTVGETKCRWEKSVIWWSMSTSGFKNVAAGHDWISLHGLKPSSWSTFSKNNRSSIFHLDSTISSFGHQRCDHAKNELNSTTLALHPDVVVEVANLPISWNCKYKVKIVQTLIDDCLMNGALNAMDAETSIVRYWYKVPTTYTRKFLEVLWDRVWTWRACSINRKPYQSKSPPQCSYEFDQGVCIFTRCNNLCSGMIQPNS